MEKAISAMEDAISVDNSCVQAYDTLASLELQRWVWQSCVVSSGGAPTPAGTSVFTKHNWGMGIGYLWLNGWGIYHLMGGAFMA